MFKNIVDTCKTVYRFIVSTIIVTYHIIILLMFAAVIIALVITPFAVFFYIDTPDSGLIESFFIRIISAFISVVVLLLISIPLLTGLSNLLSSINGKHSATYSGNSGSQSNSLIQTALVAAGVYYLFFHDKD